MLQGFRNMGQKQDKKKAGDKNDAQSVGLSNSKSVSTAGNREESAEYLEHEGQHVDSRCLLGLQAELANDVWAI